jgi:23S rRNA pseudouridine1911/1915/1917 synthase
VEDRRLRFVVKGEGGRLDHILVDQVPDLSRSRLQKLIRAGKVTVDGQIVTKTGYQLEGGESVTTVIPAPKPASLQPEPIDLQIVFENDDLMVVDKPAGMVVHPSAGHQSGTLVHAILAHAPDLRGVGEERRPGISHRLDKDTSGLIVIAKHDQAMAALQAQFKERTVEKRYLALVDGTPNTSSGRIEAPIGRDPSHRKRMAVVPLSRGRESLTIFHTLERLSRHTLLEVFPRTGRTHQIRVHLAYIGVPIVADRLYGRRKTSYPLSRQFLHATELTITLPGDERMTFEAPLPPDLQGALDELRALD